MPETSFDLDYVAQLARIALSPEEKSALRGQLKDILSYVDQLNEVDVDGVEPTAHPVPRQNVARKDACVPGLSHEDALGNAPAQANGLFMVPKIVD